MAVGIIVRDANGVVVVDNSTFLGRFLGQVDIGTGTGTVSDDQFTTGIPWCIPLLSTNNTLNVVTSGGGGIDMSLWLSAPTVAFSGNQLVWTRPANFPTMWGQPTCTLIYGVT